MANQPKSYRKFVAGSVTAALVATAVSPVFAAEMTFKDEADFGSHENNIYKAAEAGFINGYTTGDNAGKFMPNDLLRRGQVVKTLARYLEKEYGKQDVSNVEAFKDVPADYADEELYKASLVVKKFGAFQGVENNLLPNNFISRQAMAKVIVKAFDLNNDTDKENKVEDLDAADEEFRPYIEILSKNGVTAVTNYNPKDHVSRAQYASFLVRSVDAAEAQGVNVVSVGVSTKEEVTTVSALVQNGAEDTEAKVEIFANGDTTKAGRLTKTVKVVNGEVKADFSDLPAGTHVAKVTAGNDSEVAEFTIFGEGLPPTVAGVEAINAKQYEVKFNTAIDKNTVISSDGSLVDGLLTIKLAGNNTALTVNDNNAKLSEDGKTLTVTLSGAQAFDGTYEFKLLKDKVKTTTGINVLAEDYVQALIVSDKVAPVVSEVTSSAKTTTNVVTVKFSEPIQISGASAYVNGKAATVQAGSKPNEVVLTSTDALEAGKSYSVTLLNFKDYNNNFTSANPLSTTVSVKADANAPVVQNLVAVRDNLIEVTFDKAINSNTLGAGVVKLLDANGVAQGGTINAAIKPNTDGKIVTVTTSTAVPFNDNGVFSGSLVLPDSIKDTAGNQLNAITKAVTLTKDKVAPTLAGTAYLAPGTVYQGATYANGAIVAKFNEQITNIGTDYKLISPSGGVATSSLVTGSIVVANDSREVLIPLTGGLTTGNYSLILGNSVVEDLSTQANDNVAVTTTVAVGAGSDSVKPVIASIASSDATAAVDQASGTSVAVSFTDNTGLDLNSVRNVSNYLLDGMPLPTGSYITITHGSGSTDTAATNVTATINIPAQAMHKDTTTAVLNVNNIKDKAGNFATPVASAALSLNDDVSPTLQSGVLANNGTLALTFSEKFTADPVLASDIQFAINGTTVALANNTNIATLAAGTGSDLDKYVVTFKAVVDGGADLNNATTADNRLFLDVDGSNGYNAGDILIKTGTTTAVGSVSALDANLFSSLKVVVVDAVSNTITDNSTLNNPVKPGTVTVK